MSQKFKAIIIDNQNEKFTREIKEIDTSHLKDGNVLIKVDYSSLNYKDALILNNGGKIVRKFPFVPGIDFSGMGLAMICSLGRRIGIAFGLSSPPLRPLLITQKASSTDIN